MHKIIQKIIFAVLITISIGIISCKTQNDKSPSMEGTHFKRTTLLIADIDQSLKIYRDILGFSVHHISESDEDSYSYPVFKIPKEAAIRFCTLDSPDQIRTLALTEVKGVPLEKPITPHSSASVIRVKELPQVMEKIVDLGLEHTKVKRDTNSNGLTFIEQAFVDFDGHLIVLYELK